METTMRLSKGIRRHIRNEKAQIRRQFGSSPEGKEKLEELLKRFYDKNVNAEVVHKETKETPKASRKPNKTKKK